MMATTTRNSLSLYSLICWLLIVNFVAAGPLCSAFCLQTGCTDYTPTTCSGGWKCNANWVWNAAIPECDVDTTKNREFIDCSSDATSYSAGGAITVTPNTFPSTSCPAITTTQFWGSYTANQVITTTLPGGTIISHYALQVLYVLILIDTDSSGSTKWDSNAQFKTTLVGATPTQAKSTSVSSSSANGNGYCGDTGKKELYFQIKYVQPNWYTHTALSTDIQFTITSNNSQSGALWVFKEFIIVGVLCHATCLTCNGALINNCLSCDGTLPLCLNDNTCNANCLTNYGVTADPSLCVLCSNRCILCSYVADNCSSCTTSGPNKSYLYDDLTTSPKCVANCPVGYFNNNTALTCDLCDPTCSACSTTSTFCTTCVTGYGFYNNKCYQPCDDGFYLSNSGQNCTKCSGYCVLCNGTSTNCSVCTLTGTYMSYLSVNSCVTSCPTGTYPDTNNTFGPNLCLPCDVSCSACTGSPSPCSECNTPYFFFNGTCVLTCPTDYKQNLVNRHCQNCSVFCINLTIDMHFADATNSQLYIDMSFSRSLDETTFPYQTWQTLSISPEQYSLSLFNISYQWINNTCYRIILQPKGYIFLYNATITVTTEDQPETIDMGLSGIPFQTTNYLRNASIVWFVINQPEMSELQYQIVNGFSAVSDRVSQITTMPGFQEIKKTGLFSMLFSGAQITSSAVLCNTVPSQNFYEGVRFFAMFVYFDVPPWQKDSSRNLYLFSAPAGPIVQNARLLSEHSQARRLYDITNLKWRFSRTGFTSFFIFDFYVPLSMILVCWLAILICHKCLQSKKWPRKLASGCRTVLYKLHEVAIMYVCLATILEWLYFDAASAQRWVSFGLCLLFNIYFFGYELYVYYDMINYPHAQIGNNTYDYYVQRYSCLLKNIRFEEYDPKEKWSPKHWFRPYNYHVLSYYKKFLMMITLPLFYDIPYAQISMLMIIQAAEIIRFAIVRPYSTTWRNFTRFILELVLLVFFTTVLAQSYLVTMITLNDPNTLSLSISLFYAVGWVGFVLVFIFNIGFFVLLIINFIIGCKYSNRKLMSDARKKYYFEKVSNYEKEFEEVPLPLMNRWVKLGNLNAREEEKLPDINVRIECYRIQKQGSYFDIQISQISELYMNIEFNFHAENNTRVGRKLAKKIVLTRQVSPYLYAIADMLFREHNQPGVDCLTLKTFLKVVQTDFLAGDKIPFTLEDMFQRIEIEPYVGEKINKKLPALLNGFPINESTLRAL